MQGVSANESRALVLLSNDNGLLQDAELAWDVRGLPLRAFPWQDPAALLQRFFQHAPAADPVWRVSSGGSGADVAAHSSADAASQRACRHRYLWRMCSSGHVSHSQLKFH